MVAVERVPDELPRELYDTKGSGKVVHLTADCRAIPRHTNGGRFKPTEYLRRAGGRLCKVCGDGRDL